LTAFLGAGGGGRGGGGGDDDGGGGGHHCEVTTGISQCASIKIRKVN